MVWYLFLFISCHSLCLLGITDIFFISKHHAGMPTWQTSGEAVLSGAIIQPWQLLHSWAYCQNTSAQEGRPEGGLERQTWVWLGLYCVREGGGVRLQEHQSSGSVIFPHGLRPIRHFLASSAPIWWCAHRQIVTYMCTHTQARVHEHTHRQTRESHDCHSVSHFIHDLLAYSDCLLEMNP